MAHLPHRDIELSIELSATRPKNNRSQIRNTVQSCACRVDLVAKNADRFWGSKIGPILGPKNGPILGPLLIFILKTHP